MSRGDTLYKVNFHNCGKLYELHAKKVHASAGLLGFVEVEGLMFDNGSTLLVDPTAERLKAEFAGTRRLYLPLPSVMRIEEVEKQEAIRFRWCRSRARTSRPFPHHSYSRSGTRGTLFVTSLHRVISACPARGDVVWPARCARPSRARIPSRMPEPAAARRAHRYDESLRRHRSSRNASLRCLAGDRATPRAGCPSAASCPSHVSARSRPADR